MPIVEPLTEEQIDKDLYEQISFFTGPLGFVPNSICTMAYHPKIASAFTALNRSVMECHGQLTPEFKRLMGYLSSYAAGCRYCQAHTSLSAERFGCSEERFNDIWNFEDSEHFSDAEKAALKFAYAAACVPNEVDKKIASELKAHWSDPDIVEIMGVIAMYGYLNRWNDSMSSELEDMPTAAGEKLLAEKTDWEVGKHQ